MRLLHKKWSPMTRKKVEILVLLLALLPLRVSCNVIGGGRCLKCDDFNRLSNGQCIDSAKECDGCKPGFVLDDADPRLCYELELISTPSNVSVEIGTSIRLPCVFSALVECYWMKNGHVLTIGGHSRYQYAQSTTDNRRRDCSLDITDVSGHDTGQWTCGSVATSDFNSTQSEPFRISAIIRKTTVDLKPETKELESDADSVTTTATGHGHQAVAVTEPTQPNSLSGNFSYIIVLSIMSVVITGLVVYIFVLRRKHSKGVCTHATAAPFSASQH